MKQLIPPFGTAHRSDPVAAELDVIVARRLAQPPPPGSQRPAIRPATDADRLALEELALRCSPDTLRRRFHAPVGNLPVAKVAGLLGGSGCAATLVAEAGAAVVGIGTLHVARSGDGEIAVLVEDAWQHTGLGHRLTAHLLRSAGEHHVSHVVADVMREPAFVVERLGRITADTTVAFDGPVATVRIPVASLAA